MKKLLFSISFFFCAYGTMAQCAIDPSFTSPGIFAPAGSYFGTDSIIQLPDAPLASMYDQVIQIVVPNDTTIDFGGSTVSAGVDSFRVDGILNLPPGLSYNCNNPTCAWEGGGNGCVRIFGTPTGSLNNYNLGVQIRAFLRVFSIPIDSLETLDSYSIKVVNPVSIAENEGLTIKVFPNPSNGPISVELGNLNTEVVDWTLIDLSGRIVQKGSFENIPGNSSQLLLETSTNGLYLIQFETSKGAITRRVSLHE